MDSPLSVCNIYSFLRNEIRLKKIFLLPWLLVLVVAYCHFDKSDQTLITTKAEFIDNVNQS